MADPITAIAVGTAAAQGATATGAALATTAAGAATSGIFGAAGAFSLSTTLSTLGTAGTLFSTIQGARAESSISKSEGRFAEFNAKQEEIRGVEEANVIKRDVARALATANARGAASGISISSGSPVTAQQEALRDANNALSTVGTNTKIAAETERIRAQISKRRSRNSIRSGATRAASILGNFVTEQNDRGVFNF